MNNFYKNIKNKFILLFPGFLVASLIALAAQFLSNNYQVPAMLMALLLGMAVHFLGEDGRCVKGLNFSSKKILQLGIVLLGVKISVDSILTMDFNIILIITSAVIFTIFFSIFILKAFGFDWKFGVLLGGSVAICGASAAMAIAAVLPKDNKSDERLTFVILGVTLLSTIAMIIYPLLSNWLLMDEKNAGIFLGATIHDVAQVVGAGFSISDLTGETSTLVKLYRVTLLFPIVLVISMFSRLSESKKRYSKKIPFIPMFVILFIFFAFLNSINLVPELIKEFASRFSKWSLLIAIAAVGAKTRLQSLVNIGLTPSFLVLVTSLFLMVFILIFI